MLDRLLNALASRLGTALSISIMVMIAIGGVGFVRHGLDEIQMGRSLFQLPRLREGFVALSDVYRLTGVVKEALVEGTVSDIRKQQIQDAADILFVRRDSFARHIGNDVAADQAATVTAALSEVVALTDAALGDRFSELDAYVGQLILAGERARGALVQYLDELHRMQQVGYAHQSGMLLNFTVVLGALLASMCTVGVVAILLLRREVVGRFRREQAERRADFLAYFDPMTGLPNRVQFQDQLAARISRREEFSLVFVDLDDFKGINDTHGHAMGDTVLREIGNRLAVRARSYGGMAARLAGDEFAALIPTENAAKLRYFANELLEDCLHPVGHDGTELHCGISVGIAATRQVGENGRIDEAAMARAADFALYEAKSAGRGTYRMYDRVLEGRHTARRAILDAIPNALAREEFIVAYQPKVDLRTRAIYGFEALIRWQRNGETVSPGEFLPLAEESRRILEIDEYVLDRATRQVARWNVRYGISISVSVNLSALHFEDTRVIAMVESALERSGLDPALLTLEITESMLLEDWRNVEAILGALRALGVSISLDDFGTGYSSLAYLRKIAADELKIDRSFVTEIEQSQETRFILDAVIDIAKSLGMSIVVEGIETEMQATIVRAFGCDRGQGFLFGAPVFEIEAERLIAEPANRLLA